MSGAWCGAEGTPGVQGGALGERIGEWSGNPKTDKRNLVRSFCSAALLVQCYVNKVLNGTLYVLAARTNSLDKSFETYKRKCKN